MKAWRIFLLSFQHVLENRSRSFIWVLYVLLPAVVFMLFWIGVVKSSGGDVSGWNFSTITSYYFLLTVLGSTVIAHIEEDVAEEDIRLGELTNYLMKPFSYFWTKFLEETPWRLIQGAFGVLIVIAFIFIFGNFFTLASSPLVIVLALLIMVLAYMLCFTFKMSLGLSAFWLTDSRGLFQILEVLLLIFGGFVVPITLLPEAFSKIAQVLPFSYIVYYPIVAIQGNLSITQMLTVIFAQLAWIFVFYLVYKVVWSEGRRKYTAMGQ